MDEHKSFSGKSFLIGTTTGVVIASLALMSLFLATQERHHEDVELTRDLGTPSTDSPNSTESYDGSRNARTSDHKSEQSKTGNASLISLIEDDIADKAQLAELLQATNELWSEQGMSAMQLVHDSINDTALRETLVGSMLYSAMSDGHENVFSEALALEGGARRWILHEIVTDWARNDPASTVATVWALASTDPSIRMLQRRAVWEWAELEPRKMLANMNAVPDNIRDFAQEKALLALARIDPVAATEYLPNFFDSSREATLAHAIAEHWTKLSPMAALDWVESHPFSSSSMRAAVLETTFRTYADVDPQGAFEAALKQPKPLGKGAMESIVVAEIAKSDASHAANLLTEVRNEAYTVFNAYRDTAQAMVQFHHEFDQALELGKKLSHWHDSFYRDLTIHWASHQPVELLDRLELIPQDSRSYAAYSLIAVNSVSLVLDSQQIQRAQAYLNEDDLARVEALPKHFVNAVQFPTHPKAAYSPAELATLAAKSSAAQREIKLQRQGILKDNSSKD